MTNQPKQKTAIRYLIEEINYHLSICSDPRVEHVLIGLLKRSESLEPVNEQHIKDAFDEGETRRTDSGTYFNYTFEKP